MRPERHGQTADAATLRAQLRNVYWIGGGSGAGKSVIARRVAARHGLRLYATDDVMPDHASRCAPGACPNLTEFAPMDMDEAKLLELRVIEVDTTMTEEALAQRVTETFGL